MNATKVSFRGGGDFWTELKSQVQEYLAQPGIEKRGHRRLHRKAAVIGIWAFGSYLGLVMWAANWQQVMLCGFSLVLALDAAAFNISHDGNHGSFSKNRSVNRMAGFVLELLGGSSFTWKVKHNQAHHTYPNVDGMDEDIDVPPFGRVASTQPYYGWHRAQHVYLWFMYGLVTLRWQVWGDVWHLACGHIGPFKLKGFNVREIMAFVLGKVLFVGWVFALPLALHWSWDGVLTIVAVFLALNWVMSVVMITTFQLAHCVDEALFSSAADADGQGKLPNTWAKHQVLSTTDFCPQNRLVTWFAGGLNFQVVHHLFPRTAHVHYPAISKMVQEACDRHGVDYVCHPDLGSALKSHYRHLRNMGRPPTAAPQGVL